MSFTATGPGGSDTLTHTNYITVTSAGPGELVTTTITYTYDPLYRLTSAVYSGTLTNTYTYAYDAAGNRTAMTDTAGAHSYTYDNANRLVLSAVEGLTSVDSVTYTWDDNGNLRNNGVFTFTYDSANRLITVTNGTTLTLGYRYNGDGVLVAQTTGGVETTFVQDVGGALTQILVETSGSSTERHIYGMVGVLAWTESGTWVYPLKDALGSVRQLTNEAGQVEKVVAYSPYGLPDGGKADALHGYTSERWYSDVELLYLRARWYQPMIGIFLSSDLVVGEHPFLYAQGNPVNLTDPSGMVPTRSNVKSGDFSYSCNCGWIDWGHASGGFAWEVISKLEELNSTTELIDISAVAFRQSIYQGVVTLWISKEPDLPTDELIGVALGIFKISQWAAEELQGDVPFFGMGSYFSEEDLPSNLIGFYRAVWEKTFLGPAIGIMSTIAQCEVLGKEDSLAVLDAYYDELPAGDMGEGGFVRWREWEGRLADSCTIEAKCGDIADRHWPSVFSTIEEIWPEPGGVWEIVAGKTCRGIYGCEVPLPINQ